jgi:hypothetical protein
VMGYEPIRHNSSQNTAQIVKVPMWHNPWDSVRPSVHTRIFAAIKQT